MDSGLKESTDSRLARLRERATASRAVTRAAVAEESRKLRMMGGIGGRRARARRAEAKEAGEAAGSFDLDLAAQAGHQHVDLDAARRDAEEAGMLRKKRDEEIKSIGLVPSLERAIRQPASSAAFQDDHLDKRDRKRARNTGGFGGFGWSSYNPETHFGVHKKRVADAGLDKAATAELQQEEEQSGDGVRDSSAVSGGGGLLEDTAQVKPENVERMVAELDRAVKRRKTFIRDRGHEIREGGDFVDFINNRNAVFNNKASRSFDKYTQEVKANLERGTAV